MAVRPRGHPDDGRGLAGSGCKREHYLLADWRWISFGKGMAPSSGQIATWPSRRSKLTREQGNAADAMVGTTLCVGVIGIVPFRHRRRRLLLVRDSSGRYETVDYRETAPAAASEDMYQGNILGSVYGGLAAGVPGELRALSTCTRTRGTCCLPISAICVPPQVAPSIQP